MPTGIHRMISALASCSAAATQAIGSHRTGASYVLAGVILFTLLSCSSARAEPTPAPVHAKPLDEVVIYPRASAPATVISLNDSRISAQVPARLIKIPVQVGEIVEPDAVLARLDETDYRLQVKQIEASLKAIAARIELARFQLEQTRGLASGGHASEEQLKLRQAELEGLQGERAAQQASLSAARADLARTTLRAPFRGVVMERLANVGETTGPGTPVLRLLDLERLEVSAQVSSRDAKTLPQAAALSFVADGQEYPLQLRAVTPAIDLRDRSREARFTFAEERPLPGQAGRLVWRTGVAHLPPGLVVRRKDGLGVFMLDSAQAEHVRFVPLSHAEEGRAVPLRSPLNGLVVTEGRFRLLDGDPVTVE